MFKLMRKMRVLRFVASAVLGLALMIGVFTLATPTMAQTYIIFDAQAQPSITRPLGINNAGLIVGITAGAAFPNTRGFVGNPDGNITLFAVANTTNASTAPSSINGQWPDRGTLRGLRREPRRHLPRVSKKCGWNVRRLRSFRFYQYLSHRNQQ